MRGGGGDDDDGGYRGGAPRGGGRARVSGPLAFGSAGRDGDGGRRDAGGRGGGGGAWLDQQGFVREAIAGGDGAIYFQDRNHRYPFETGADGRALLVGLRAGSGDGYSEWLTVARVV